VYQVAGQINSPWARRAHAMILRFGKNVEVCCESMSTSHFLIKREVNLTMDYRC
jgi:hypothetical protein